MPNCKVVFLGEPGVGKTCIVSRFLSGIYDDRTESSNGASYASKRIEVDGQYLRLDLWDTAGQEKFRSLTKFFYKDASIVILVYDITKRESFEELIGYWFDKIRTSGDKNIIIGIAGNKSDNVDEEVVSENEAKEFAQSTGAVFGLTSAFRDTGINELFEKVGAKYLDVLRENGGGQIGNRNNIRLGNNRRKKDGKSC